MTGIDLNQVRKNNPHFFQLKINLIEHYFYYIFEAKINPIQAIVEAQIGEEISGKLSKIETSDCFYGWIVVYPNLGQLLQYF
mgnify:CR=1 FL=1